MKTQINEELNLIKYLFDYKKGRVISEQNSSLLTEVDSLLKSDSKTKEEFPICVRNLGDVVTGSGGISTIKDKKGNLYFNNNTAVLQPGVDGNTGKDYFAIKNVDYFCDANGTLKFGKPNTKELLLINTKKCGWGTDVNAYEASGWKCDSKMDATSIIRDTAINIQNKLLSLNKEIGPKGVDGKLGLKSMLSIWEVLKTVKK